MDAAGGSVRVSYRGGLLIKSYSKQAELQRAAAVRWKATLFSTKVTLPTAADLLPVVMAEIRAFEPPLIYDSFPVAPGLDRRNIDDHYTPDILRSIERGSRLN